MTIELKNSGKKDQLEGEIYHLYINGKTDGIEYEEDGTQGKIYPWSIKRKHMERLMQIKCMDYPDELRIWNTTNYKLPPGELGVFGIDKKGKRMEFDVWFTFEEKGKYDDKNWPFNTYLFGKKIYSLSSGTVLKRNDKHFFSESLDAKFIFHSDLKGTIGDKFNIAYKTLRDIIKRAEQQIISEAKQYLKARKIKI